MLVWDNLNTHVSRTMRRLIDARFMADRLLPPDAPEFNPAEDVWAHPKRSLANLTKPP
ncbi:transposase [Streptomyces sp. 5K101]|uniref:transposase n=1 Tax=Streptomyces sp. 5K101 TaxID=3390037 RepID=UPI00397634DF